LRVRGKTEVDVCQMLGVSPGQTSTYRPATCR
jgi:hypothetical protein